MKTSRIARTLAVVALGAASVGCRAPGGVNEGPGDAPAAASALRPQYLEIVTPEVDATCRSIEASHGIRFGVPQPDLGGARTADLAGGGLIGVRAPMHSAEQSVVRPYLLVDDIGAAVENAVAAGGEVALPPTPISGRGTFAIYFLGGIEHGLWQLERSPTD